MFDRLVWLLTLACGFLPSARADVVNGPDILSRLKHHEVVTLSHRQFHRAEHSFAPIYPDTGILTFDAFGRHYKIRVEKNKGLFPADGLQILTHRANAQPGDEPIETRRVHVDHCHYRGRVLSDPMRGTRAALSLCSGEGVRGWIHAFNETIVIRPKRYLTHGDAFKGRHYIDDAHIVYRYNDLDRSTLHHIAEGHSGCAHDHPATAQLLDKLVKKHPERFPDGRASLSEYGLAPKHAHLHEDDDHDHHVHDHEHSHSAAKADVLSNPQSEEAKALLRKVAARGKHAKDLKVTPFVADAVAQSDAHGRKPRRLQSSSDTTRYVELAAVNDPARWRRMLDRADGDEDGAYDRIVNSDISIVNTLSSYYLDQNWGDFVGDIQIILSSVVIFKDWTGDLAPFMPDALVNSKNSNAGASCGASTEPSMYSSSGSGSSYCEADYADYLYKLHDWRTSGLAPDHDNAQLFSYYDFYSSVIGYANVPGVCLTSTSGGIEQCTYDDEYNANIVAHEMGHNFDMSHDGSGNSCDEEKYIMASVGNPAYTPSEFSACSVGYLEGYFTDRASTLTCLDNIPYETKYAVCGNGFKEQGEACDCGDDDCEANGDPCCDGDLCQLFGDAECSANDECCDQCQIKSAGSVCRALDSGNTCDIVQEVCDGDSASCPSDSFYVEGTECVKASPEPGASKTGTGMCYNGQCTSMQYQCYETGWTVNSGVLYEQCDNYGSVLYDWKSNTCNDVTCERDNDNSCNSLSSQYDVSDGTACHNGGDYGVAKQCKNGNCRNSTELFTCKWTIGAWSGCVDADGNDFPCISDESDGTPGNQTRTVQCTFQNNTQVTDGSCSCDEDSEPTTVRQCNNYICEFCREQSDGHHQCYPNGDCNEKKGVCECDYGYDGETCDIYPELTWIGVTKRTYRDADQGNLRISLKADPYGLLNETSDDFGVTIPVVGVWTMTDITMGDLLSIRWNSSGSLELLSVGWLDLQASGDSIGGANGDDYTWPLYLGIAEDKQECDSDDWELIRNECADFSFKLPATTQPGEYQIIVKFNNDFIIYSEVLNVSCSEYQCGKAGHGYCVAPDLPCECTDGFTGVRCNETPCGEWSFLSENAGSYAIPDTYPRCINDEASCNATWDAAAAKQLDALCGACTGSSLLSTPVAHSTGPFCEVPIDGCGGLSQTDCDTESEWCMWHATNAECVYRTCAMFNSTECGAEIPDYLRDLIEASKSGLYSGDGSNSTFNESTDGNSTDDGIWTIDDVNQTWLCEWNSGGVEGFCARKACSGLESDEAQQCDQSSLRRPLDDYTSICEAWYCDCTTTRSVSDLSTMTGDSNDWVELVLDSEIESAISNGEYESLTCTTCDLDCGYSSEPNDDCTLCLNCPFDTKPFMTGKLCKQLYWVINTKLDVPWEVSFASRKEEFEALFLEDFARLMEVPVSRLGIWQMKGSGTSTIVYWTYSFLTDSELPVETQRQNAQAEGGELFLTLTKMASRDGSPVFRGFVTNSTDSSYSMSWCLPYFEECDPDDRLDYLLFFLICAGAAFAFQALIILTYHLATKKKRQRKYEDRVEEVRRMQRSLMRDDGAQAQRVGFRDVSKSRARRISKAKKDDFKHEEKKLKDRATKEKEMHKRIEDDRHKPKASDVELHAISSHERGMFVDDFGGHAGGHHGGGGMGPAGGFDDPGPAFGGGGGHVASAPGMGPSMRPLPFGWMMYYDKDGIPYYYNAESGETQWRHPLEAAPRDF